MTVTLAYPGGHQSPVQVVTESSPSIYWCEGHRAWHDGKPCEANPYDPFGRRAREWQAGWAAGLAEYEAAGETMFDFELGEAGA